MRPPWAGWAKRSGITLEAARELQELAVVQRDDQALADTSQTDDALAGDGAQRGIDGAQQERREQARALEGDADDATLERLEIDGDVGQLGQRLRPQQPVDEAVADATVLHDRVAHAALQRVAGLLQHGFQPKTPASSRMTSNVANAYSVRARSTSVAMPRPQNGSASQ